ncbi:MAG: hypothetical protein ACLFOY_02690 [Desulfatibacillaceae bacterium]
MTYLLHAALLLVIMLLRTTDLGRVLPFLSGYDLFLPYVMALGFFRPVREGGLVTAMLALVLDLVSAAPFGLHAMAYGAVYAGAWWVPRFLEARNVFFLILASIVCVAAKDLLFWGAGVINLGAAPDVPHLFEVLARSAGLAALSGWLLILAVDGLCRKVDRWVTRQMKLE